MADTYLSRTPSSQGDRRTYTISCWVKRHTLAYTTTLMDVFLNASQWYSIGWRTNDKFYIYHADSGTDYGYVTDMVFRDVSAWYHIVLAVDTTQASASNRVKLYVNGEQVTFNQDYGDFPQNESTWVNSTNAHHIGRYNDIVRYSEFTLAHYNFTDGTAYQASDFGETDTNGQWKPKTTPSVTYGTNGFFLKFASSGSLGTDSSGNGNDFTKNGSGDQVTDTPDNNFATLNPLIRGAYTLSEGNLKINGASSETIDNSGVSTFSMTTGKWYCEMKPTDVSGFQNFGIIELDTWNQGANSLSLYGYFYKKNGDKIPYEGSGGTSTAYGTAISSNDIVSLLYDADNGTITFYLNGVSQGDAFTGIDTSKTWNFVVWDNTTTGIGITEVNFGNPSFAITSGNTDDNGYGNFEYAPPSGYLALCTKNLASVLSPTIGDGSQYFDTYLDTASSSNGTYNLGNLSFQPDFSWRKNRNNIEAHFLFDSSRGYNETKMLSSNRNVSETTASGNLIDTTVSARNGGMTVVEGSINSGEFYFNSRTYVTWNWLVNGGSTSSNTDGDITTTVQVSQTSGFSILTWTGNGTPSQSLGHGLGITPKIMIHKNRDQAVTWQIFGSTIFDRMQFDTGGDDGNLPCTFSSTTITLPNLTNNTEFNSSGDNFVSYVFAEIEGYSKFGKYKGNGSTDGTFVYTGFRPSFVLIKRTDTTGDWHIDDATRNTFNPTDARLDPNSNAAESSSIIMHDFTSNGFKTRTTSADWNASGGTYIYMAFAEHPFVDSTGRPVTAR